MEPTSERQSVYAAIIKDDFDKAFETLLMTDVEKSVLVARALIDGSGVIVATDVVENEDCLSYMIVIRGGRTIKSMIDTHHRPEYFETKTYFQSIEPSTINPSTIVKMKDLIAFYNI